MKTNKDEDVAPERFPFTCLFHSFDLILLFCLARRGHVNKSKTATFIHPPWLDFNIYLFLRYCNFLRKCLLSVKSEKALIPREP